MTLCRPARGTPRIMPCRRAWIGGLRADSNCLHPIHGRSSSTAPAKARGLCSRLQQPDELNRTSVPISQGGLKLDRGVSDYDRPHRLTIAYLWAVPGPRSGWWKYRSWPVGRWQALRHSSPELRSRLRTVRPEQRRNSGGPARHRQSQRAAEHAERSFPRSARPAIRIPTPARA